MDNLNEALESLHELDELRDRVKKLREQGRLALQGIENITFNGEIKPTVETDKEFCKNWISSGNEVEIALLVKVQNHRDMSDNGHENDIAEASTELKNKLRDITLKSLFPKSRREGTDATVPVLVAARAMQALIRRAETVFSRATLICYYRIIRELYVAANPDWTIGAARADVGGSTSAFITGECIRAILAFDGAIRRTVEFFINTLELVEKYTELESMLTTMGHDSTSGQALGIWADKAIERMWLDWYISTNSRRGEMALHCGTHENELLPIPCERASMKSVHQYITSLREKLLLSVRKAKETMGHAKSEIEECREEQNPFEDIVIRVEGVTRIEKRRKPIFTDEDVRRYRETVSAHNVAFRIVERGVEEAGRAEDFCNGQNKLTDILCLSIAQFEDISHRIHRVLEPAKRYVRNVVNRELANATTGQFDAGELVFAAASFGATTDWKINERLTGACDLLIKNLPGNGSLPTRRPFHSTPRGYRLLPIGCEMARSFAQLLQKTNYGFEPSVVRRMLNLFQDKLIYLPRSIEGKQRIAWNFEGAPSPDKPCIWVTAAGVIALDRMVRMINERINTIVLKHFEVIIPDKPHTHLKLNNHLYPDYGFSKYYLEDDSIAIRLEQMRAHVMRATLPASYRGEKEKEGRVFSAIFYGPPGTGKTTLVESLALSSNVPLIRLSPSDLTVQGQGLIEGRARSVFEALSMLTQVVIILDEFEPVLRRNTSREDLKSADSAFKFLLTGMLPKLVKLNDAAKKQSFVYCLATNHIEEIDNAAKRIGRFDWHLPVYNPDPLSRTGTFLYRLQQYTSKFGPSNNLHVNEHNIKTLLAVIAKTADMPASKLAEDCFRLEKDSPCFESFLKGNLEEIAIEETREVRIPENERQMLSAQEIEEREWILEWERNIKGSLYRNPSFSASNPLAVLSETLPKRS